MKVTWSDCAICDVIGIRDYFARTSPVYSKRIAERIFDSVKILERMPYFGAEVQKYNDPDLRELYCHPYRILYRISPTAYKL